ncbi:hypothetical protein [Actinopolymorpha cephalotaxi]|nr:hypothetical protein [Actinopolymorpha cephalotaxi]NYH86652.1 hypothetical protein [Actinopolymorpha cephalotaxi]
MAALGARRSARPALLGVAALRWAMNPAARTPAGIALDGPHWRITTAEPGDMERATSTVPVGVLCDYCGRSEEHCRRAPRIDDNHTFTPPGSVRRHMRGALR